MPWNTAPSFDQSSQLEPGISVEQMLADASIQDTNNNIFDDELMSMWMAAPTDVAFVLCPRHACIRLNVLLAGTSTTGTRIWTIGVGMQTQTGTPTSGRDGWQMAAVIYLEKISIITVLYM
jgi:hypothetical protein